MLTEVDRGHCCQQFVQTNRLCWPPLRNLIWNAQVFGFLISTMRLSDIVFSVAAVLLASCDAATAMAQTQLAQMTTADRIEPLSDATNFVQAKRFLRIVKEQDADNNAGEERGAAEVVKKLLPQKLLEKLKLKKIPLQDTLPERFVNKLLKNEQFRTSVFRDWAKADGYIDGNSLVTVLDMNKASSGKLVKSYENFLA
ncbi:unnamed protein product [Phytophthora lilii]|uniref:RxLR effector protein n=1 Tax=Phytophthora lilii TaxID=2077276 RepID=A0A9W6XH70_9STRA|nr:unnamed protein product [Phytophthora lilii]